jgi:RNA polymerase sigma-70 factor (ECF subfamily)
MTSEERDRLAERFNERRPRLRAIAQRILGSPGDAEDAIQETWLRLGRADASAIDNLDAWLTTVVSRVCLTMLEARRSRPPLAPAAAEELPEAAADPAQTGDPEYEALLADTIGSALAVVLDTLKPPERVAFVLHDVFAVPFDEIAPIVDRSPVATRQLASRARARIADRGATAHADRLRQAALVEAFLAAARRGDFEALLALLDPDVVLHADATVVRLGAAAETRGAEPVGRFVRRARGATPALLDGAPALVWIRDGRVAVAYAFTTGERGITAIDLIGDPDRLAQLDLVIATEERL